MSKNLEPVTSVTSRPVLLLMTCCLLSYATAQRKILLGYIAPLTGLTGLSQVGSAATMAIEQAKADGHLNNTDINFVFFNGACNGKIATGGAYQLIKTRNVDGFVGFPCSACLFLSNYNLPYLSYSSINADLANKTRYSTLVRMMSPFNNMAKALGLVMQTLSWNYAAIVTTQDTDGYCLTAAASVLDAANSYNLTITLSITVPLGQTNILPYQYGIIKNSARIVLICGVDDFIRNFMIGAYDNSMTSGDFVFIAVGILPTSAQFPFSWIRNDSLDTIAKQAYFPLLQMYTWSPNTTAAMNFRLQIPIKLVEPPWNYNQSLASNTKGSLYAAFMFDVVYMYALVVDVMVARGLDYRDGNTIMNVAKTIRFAGMSGNVMLDNNADRMGDYVIYHSPIVGAPYELLMTVNMTSQVQKAQFVTRRNWGSSGYNIPVANPACGFSDELCSDSFSAVVLIAVMIALVLLSAIAGMTFYLYRNRKMKRDRQLMTWKVLYTEIDFIGNLTTSAGSSLFKSQSSDSTLFDPDEPIVSNENPHATVRLAHYKGSMVAVKMARFTVITAEDDNEMTAMRSFNHENVNEFYGLCADPVNFCVLTAYCPRGSLQDILYNDGIKLDSNFKNSFISDIIQGLEYIHRSVLGSHGRLKTSNCLVSSSWTVKLTDYGLYPVRWGVIYETDNERYSSLFWTAPEILRTAFPPRNGTPKGDIYSFGILLYDILYRKAPFQSDNDNVTYNPKDVIGRVRNGEATPFRPQIPVASGNGEGDDYAVDPRLAELMQQCWVEELNSRPELDEVASRVNVIFGGKRINVMDHMFKMMEKYTNNLESTVEERARELTDEKARIDRLLYNMLPAQVADALKSGVHLKPELFEEASVYFSDICDFVDLLSEMEPMQIVGLLGTLWNEFDDIIGKHNVYKVETIGDSYMVASGLPTKNPRHAIELANLSLEIMAQVKKIDSRSWSSMIAPKGVTNTSARVADMEEVGTHRNPKRQQQQQTRTTNSSGDDDVVQSSGTSQTGGNWFKVRIGLNSGPVVGSVVGRTMPRYCLFGDTVNVASRIETNGLPYKIHISERMYYALMNSNAGYVCSKRGEVNIKGKGIYTTYWLEGRR